MKILNASQLADLDKYSCEDQNISSWELMERAAGNAYEEIKKYIKSNFDTIKILAGPGNNGGDGLAIAYFLTKDGFDVKVYLVNFTDSRSHDNQKNLNRLKQSKCVIEDINEADDIPDFDDKDCIIDAIFGVGLNRSMPEFVQKLARWVNKSNCRTLCIDVPSGMYLDKSPGQNEEVFESDLILTFQTPKLSFYLSDYSKFVGEVKIIDIGLSQERLSEISSEFHLVDLDFARKKYNSRKRFSHKGTYGHAVIIGGSKYMLGSVILSAAACMRSGVGKTSVMMPNIGHHVLLNHTPEAMQVENNSENHISYTNLDFEPDSLGIGIGIGKSDESLKVLKLWLKNSKQPMVIDADALNLMAEHEDLQRQIPKKSILTPHPGELKRLIGDWDNDFDKIQKIKSFSKKLDVVVLAKDAFSLCVYQDEVFVNSSGNSGMATAGSGDVLTGLLTGLLAQNYKSLSTAVLGAFVHGLAGDAARIAGFEESLIASDITSHLGQAFSKLNE